MGTRIKCVYFKKILSCYDGLGVVGNISLSFRQFYLVSGSGDKAVACGLAVRIKCTDAVQNNYFIDFMTFSY